MSNAQNFGHVPFNMKPDATVAGCIEIFENVWKDSAEIIKAVELKTDDKRSGVAWTRATTMGYGVFQTARTNFDLGITYYLNAHGDDLMRTLHNRCNDLLISAGTSYHERHGIQESFWQEGYNLLKYETGQEYKAHYDSGTGGGRHVSCILYLNDDYEGGELEFPNFNIKIKPQAGMLIMFPSNFAYKHIAYPVTKGTKYAMVTWLHDRPVNQ
jgi:hypothetical protein